MDDTLLWFENAETGVPFGFGEPLPPVIADQIEAGTLRPCDPPEDAVPVSSETKTSSMADDGDKDDDDTDTATIGPAPDFEVLPDLEPDGLLEPEPEQKPRRGGRRPA